MTKNISTAHASKYQLVFPFIDFLTVTDDEKLDRFTLNCTSINLPTIAIATTKIDNPYYEMKMPSKDITFGDITATYIVDDLFENYKLLKNWMMYLKNPEEFTVRNNPMIDANLHIYSNNDNEKFSFTLKNIFPIHLEAINFSKKANDSTDLEGTVVFSIDYLKDGE